MVPTLAVTTTGDHSSVTVQDASGNQSIREVTTSITSGNLTEITSGLNEGEQVVFTLSEFSSEGQAMRMMGGAPPSGGNRGGKEGHPRD